MNRQEFTDRLVAIGECADDVQRRELIAQLTEDGGADYDNHAAAVAARDQLTKDNEDLRAANMRLFKRLGDHKDPEPTPGTEPQKKLEFKDLFNEKGGLK